MLIASFGPALAADLGLAPTFAADGPERLSFGDREPLVALMQQTPADKLLPVLVAWKREGNRLPLLGHASKAQMGKRIAACVEARDPRSELG